MVGMASDPVQAMQMENTKRLLAYQERVKEINDLEESIEKLSNEQLRAKTAEFRSLLGNAKLSSRERVEEKLDELLVPAFAVVREASWRVLKLRHYDVQLMGGMALHDSMLAEMATG